MVRGAAFETGVRIAGATFFAEAFVFGAALAAAEAEAPERAAGADAVALIAAAAFAAAAATAAAGAVGVRRPAGIGIWRVSPVSSSAAMTSRTFEPSVITLGVDFFVGFAGAAGALAAGG